MKHIILLCDGMADLPVPELGDKTPMTVANKPTMNRLATQSYCGLVQTVATPFAPGSDVANLTVLGYDPHLYYTGRSPLEAANLGIAMQADDIALRCNFVTLSDDALFAEKTMVDYSAGDITTDESAQLVKTLIEALNSESFSYHLGVSYRHCLLWHRGEQHHGKLTPPHDITGKVIGSHLPSDPPAIPLLDMMQKSVALFEHHPVNVARREKGLRPASAIWLWGAGKATSLPDFTKKNDQVGAMISAVDLLQGIGKLAGMRVPLVEGATGSLNTNFEGKTKQCLKELNNGCDFVYLHIEAPDECGHHFDIDGKVKSIEYIDNRVLAPLLAGLEEMGEDYKILILPDHATPLSTGTHTSDPVPFLLYHKSKPHSTHTANLFDETHCAKTGVLVDPGHTLLTQLFAKAT